MPEKTPEQLAAEAAEAEKAAKAAQEAAAAEEAKKAAEAAKAEEDRKAELAKMNQEQLMQLVEKERKERQDANREAQTLRQKANELEAEKKKREEAEMSELEKAQARAKELEATNAKIASDAQDTRIILAAARLGFQDPKDAVAMITRSDLAQDEANLDDLLKKVLEAKPYLAKTGSSLPNRSAGMNPGGAGDQAASKEGIEKSKSLFPTLKRLVGQ